MRLRKLSTYLRSVPNHSNEIFHLNRHMNLVGLFTQVRFGYFSVAPSLAPTPLPEEEHGKKKGNQETRIQEVQVNCNISFRETCLNELAINPISLKDASIGWSRLTLFTGAGSKAEFCRDYEEVLWSAECPFCQTRAVPQTACQSTLQVTASPIGETIRGHSMLTWRRPEIPWCPKVIHAVDILNH